MKAADVIGWAAVVLTFSVGIPAAVTLSGLDGQKAAPPETDPVAVTFRRANDGSWQAESDLAACQGELDRERTEVWWLRPHYEYRPGVGRVWVERPDTPLLIKETR